MDDYTIDRKGVIKFKNKAEGNDRLISLGKNGKIDYDKKGNITDKSITLDQKILRSHSEGSSGGNKFDQYVGTDGMATSLFKFAAKNTNVEWGLTKYTSPNGINASALTTGHENHFEPGSSFIQNSLISNMWEFREHIHNHPGGSHAPSGEIGGKDMGDRAFAKRYETYYPNSTFKIYTAQDVYNQTYNSNTPVITQELEEIVVTPKK